MKVVSPCPGLDGLEGHGQRRIIESGNEYEVDDVLYLDVDIYHIQHKARGVWYIPRAGN